MDVRVAARETRYMLGWPSPIGRWPEGGPLSHEHIRDMLTQIETGMVEGEKAHRWLGWAQCAAVAAGAGTLDDMKSINHAA